MALDLLGVTGSFRSSVVSFWERVTARDLLATKAVSVVFCERSNLLALLVSIVAGFIPDDSSFLDSILFLPAGGFVNDFPSSGSYFTKASERLA